MRKASRKLKGVRLKAPLMITIIEELGKLSDPKKLVITDPCSSSISTLIKTQKTCADQDLHLLHFEVNFYKNKIPFRDFFDWKIDKFIHSKITLERSGFSFSKSCIDLFRSYSISPVKALKNLDEITFLFCSCH